MSGGELAQSGCYCIQAVIFCHLTNGAQISTSTHGTSMGGSLTQQSPDFVKDPPKGFYPYPIWIWRTFAYASFGQGWSLTKVVRILPFADLLWPSRAIIYGHHQRLYRQLSSRNFWWVHSSKLDSVQVYVQHVQCASVCSCWFFGSPTSTGH